MPVHQLTEQIAALTNVRSLTARMFTAKENAGNHCQLGNVGLAAEVVLNWINQTAPVDGLEPARSISAIFPA